MKKKLDQNLSEGHTLSAFDELSINLSKGFTLIEILVAMTVVAVLLSISLVSYQGARKTARDGRRKADLEQIRSALEIYRSDCKRYPAGITSGAELKGDGVNCSDSNSYLSTIPADPSTDYSYAYSTNASGSTYILCSFMETDKSNTYTDCSSNCGETCNYQVKNP